VRHAAVLGRPVAHSLSPVLHAAAYLALGLTDWRYHALTCGEADLPAVLDRVRRDGRWAGLSLTMPLKQAVLPLLDEVRTELGAVNTVVVDDGRLIGHNTDIDGITAGLAELGAPLERVAVLGAGGTARAVLAALAAAGTVVVTLHVRTASRASSAAELAGRLGLHVVTAGLDQPILGTIVSTLPAGDDGLEVDGPLLDVRYAPWPTPLASTAAARGHRVVGGLPVLAGQAAEQVHLMTGQRPPVALMRTAGERALADQQLCLKWAGS
jgi:shikimate dehydrogenase